MAGPSVYFEYTRVVPPGVFLALIKRVVGPSTPESCLFLNIIKNSVSISTVEYERFLCLLLIDRSVGVPLTYSLFRL